MNPYVESLMAVAGVHPTLQPPPVFRELRSGPLGIVLTRANQLLGSYRALGRLAGVPGMEAYRGWEAHHVVEHRDLERLGATPLFPPYAEQLCVLLPPAAHRRINSLLQRHNPAGVRPTIAELKADYRAAYTLMDDYCGGGAVPVRDELCRLVDTMLARIPPAGQR